MENKAHAFWAGAFTIGLLAVIALVVFFFNFDRTERVPYDLIAHTNVTGLSTDAAVRYRGLDVGKVDSIQFDPQHPGDILIRVLVDARAPITRSTYGTLALQGVTGIAFVQLDDHGHDSARLTSSAEHVAQIPLRPGLLDQLQERGDALMKKLDLAIGDLDATLSEPNRRQAMATLASLQHAADSVNALATQLQPVARQLPGTLDAATRTFQSTNQMLANLSRPDGPLVTNLNKAGDAAQQAGAALSALEGLSARISYDTLPRVDALADDARAALQSVNRASDTFTSNPRSVLFGGAPQPAPGPGERGFRMPSGAGAR